MTKIMLFETLKSSFEQILCEHSLHKESVMIISKSLTPAEAIGDTCRKDFPILIGKEIMLQAEYNGAYGQAFTSSPANFKGTLEDILMLDILNDDYGRSLFIAALNAVMRALGLIDNTIHCKTEEPELCARASVNFIEEQYGNPKIALIGYQPAILDYLSKKFQVAVLDLNPDNIGEIRYGVKVKHGIHDFVEAVGTADIILCTGSTICNGTIVDFLNLDKNVLFYGTTIAGAAKILGLKRMCFYSK